MNPDRELTFTDHLWGWLVYSHGWPGEVTALLIALVVLAVIAGVVFAVFFLGYCIHAGTRALPRYEAAVDVMARLDPAVSEAYGVWDRWDKRHKGVDVHALAALLPLLEDEDKARRIDERLEEARARVSRARAPQPTEPTKPKKAKASA